MSGVALVLSIGLSSPLFYFTTLEVRDSIFTNTSYSYCYESWGSEQVWRAMKNDSGRQLKKQLLNSTFHCVQYSTLSL